MKDLEWKDEYAVDIPAIDLQHKRIFESFMTIVQGSTKQDRLLAEFALVQLVGILQEHFALEESMMRSLSYPELEKHIEEHRQYQASILGLAQEALRTKNKLPRDAIKAAQKELREHILTSDRHYVDFFASAAHKNKKRAGK